MGLEKNLYNVIYILNNNDSFWVSKSVTTVKQMSQNMKKKYK